MQTGYRFQATDLHQFVNTLFIQLGSSPTEAPLSPTIWWPLISPATTHTAWG